MEERPELTRRAALGTLGTLLVAACTSNSDSATTTTTTGETTTTTMLPTGGSVPSGFDLAATPDANGVLLPEGFTSQIVATTGTPVADTGFEWRGWPDGAATFETAEGWILAANHELGNGDGGVSAIRFDSSGQVLDAYSILEGTDRNCAGGATPWGTWLSCEEWDEGEVWECDPTQAGVGTVLPALGKFRHEAVAIDPNAEVLYMTEDIPDGCLYRFTPDAYPDLSAGVLEAAEVAADGSVTWHVIPDPSAATTPTRSQVAATTPFNGGEGIDWGATASGDRVWFSTKGDNNIWELDPGAQTVTSIYSPGPTDTLRGVDNVYWDQTGGLLYIAEDGDDMELHMMGLDGSTAPIMRVVGHDGSELCGPTMSPDRSTLYVSSQRGTDGAGVTFAITGPFPIV